MSEERTTIEKIAATIEEAIEEGLTELGLSEDEVDVEVLDEGSKGLFGLGERMARVRLVIKGEDEEEDSFEDDEDEDEREPREPMTHEEQENTMSIARATVTELIEKMHVRADVSVRMGESEDNFPPPIIVEVKGNDLSILIGKRAETLNALQYITRLIVGKEIGRAANIIVDVEGYRNRRERSLRQLAEQMANQAVKTGHRQTLEPMSPADRRIIHITLKDFEGVRTHSVGDEPKRKVVISPDSE